jgi:TRAP-type uncharacterized transport system substrate-binding protein
MISALITLLSLCFMSSNATARAKLRVCTGSTKGHYYAVGQLLAQLFASDLDIELIPTRGSWENLGRIHKQTPECDAMIAQDDAVALFLYEHPERIGEIERLSHLYPEHVQVICNQRVRADRLSELSPDTRMLIGSYGTGTFITWTFIKQLNPSKYGVMKAQEIGGDDGISQLLQASRPQCMLFVQALAQGSMTRVNDELGGQLRLLNVDDVSFQYPINQGGIARVLYQPVHVHRNVYPRILKKHLKTQTVDAVLYLHKSWRRQHPRLSSLLGDRVIQLQSVIQRSVN